MGRLRKLVTIFVVSLIAWGVILEWTGVRSMLGVSWGETLSMIPIEIALPVLVVLGVALALDP